MSEDPNTTDIERYLTPSDEVDNLRRAAAVTAMQLAMWRSRFEGVATDQPVQARYTFSPEVYTDIDSASADQVVIRRQDKQGGMTVYQFDAPTGHINYQYRREGVEPVGGGDTVNLLGQAARILFDADRSEAHG